MSYEWYFSHSISWPAVKPELKKKAEGRWLQTQECILISSWPQYVSNGSTEENQFTSGFKWMARQHRKCLDLVSGQPKEQFWAFSPNTPKLGASIGEVETAETSLIQLYTWHEAVRKKSTLISNEKKNSPLCIDCHRIMLGTATDN